MVYKVISVLCDEIEKGFSISYEELQYQNGKWEHENFIKTGLNYSDQWKQTLSDLTSISVPEFINWHNEFGQYLSEAIKDFIAANNLEFKVQLIALKGFDVMSSELGNAAQIAALTKTNVVADFKGISLALNGNGRYTDSLATVLLENQKPEIQLALLAVLRWREENNFLAEKTGAKRNSIGGAVWMGQEA